MPANSLAFRLAASAAIISLVLFVAAGVLLADLFKSAVERNFDRAAAGGHGRSAFDRRVVCRRGPHHHAECAWPTRGSRCRCPGWYWQVMPVGGEAAGGLASASLLEQRLVPLPGELAKRDANGVARFYLVDTNGHPASRHRAAVPVSAAAIGSIPLSSPGTLTSSRARSGSITNRARSGAGHSWAWISRLASSSRSATG